MKDFFKLKQVATTPGGVVYAFRTNFKLTLKELEEITGIGQTNLSALENDRLEIGIRRAMLLAAAFGVEPQQILFPHGYESSRQGDIERVKARAEKVFEKKRKTG